MRRFLFTATAIFFTFVSNISCSNASTNNETNNQSMNTATDTSKHYETAIFAGGCFWGVQYYFEKAKGVINTEVGYIGGHVDNPTYQQVCSHTTGHYEAIRVTYDPKVTNYEAMAKLFFNIHDPSQTDGQGPDIGEQYLSVVFYMNDAQKQIATKLIGQLTAKGMKVATQLKPATTFWVAEGYHQHHYDHEGTTPYCHHFQDKF
ncbi:MAG TPA: peptide-methionine (S)-S-oxide reductase MsrA [Bacteroidia bacterium]|jgi:peptide methionine sulfoxide reductase msrA/msrB|nr:peptide-methionine (S)-S-oxide reductase MsrA [Bacteroidia bacterium]